METTQILRGLLGSNGHYCVFAARSKDNVRIQKFYNTIEEVERAANKYDNAQELKSLFLDLDCGPSKEYPTQQLAVEALRNFCKQLSLPRPLMVNSGRGIHVYWPLTEAVSAQDWIEAAESLKIACKNNGLLADPAVTADAVRILRVPNTHNYKDDPALPVEVLGIEMPEPVVLSEFVSKLGVMKPVTTIDVGTDALYEAYAENSENVFRTIVEKTAQGKGCAQIKYVMMQQHEVSEPMWRAIDCKVLCRCRKGCGQAVRKAPRLQRSRNAQKVGRDQRSIHMCTF